MPFWPPLTQTHRAAPPHFHFPYKWERALPHCAAIRCRSVCGYWLRDSAPPVSNARRNPFLRPANFDENGGRASQRGASRERHPPGKGLYTGSPYRPARPGYRGRGWWRSTPLYPSIQPQMKWLRRGFFFHVRPQGRSSEGLTRLPSP